MFIIFTLSSLDPRMLLSPPKKKTFLVPVLLFFCVCGDVHFSNENERETLNMYEKFFDLK